MAENVTSMTPKELAETIVKGMNDAYRTMNRTQQQSSTNDGYQSHEDLLAWHNKQHRLDPESKTQDGIDMLVRSQKAIQDKFEEFVQKYDSAPAAGTGKLLEQPQPANTWSKAIAESERDEVMKIDAPATGGLIRSLSSLVGRMGRDVGMSRTTEDQVTHSQLDKEKDTTVSQRAVKGIESVSDKRHATEQEALKQEEERVYRDKVLRTLDDFKAFINAGTEGEGIKIKGGAGGDDGGSLLSTLLGGLAGAAAGLLTGVIIAKVRNAAKLAGTLFNDATKVLSKIGDKLKNTSIGKKITEWGNKAKETFNSMKKGLSEIKSSFSKTISGWKQALKDSVVGKAATTVLNKVKGAAKTVGGLLGKIGSKVAKGAEAIGKASAKLGKAVVKHTPSILKTAGKVGFKVAKGVSKVVTAPVEMAARMGEAVKNSYDVYKKSGNITNAMTTFGGGMIDSVTDTLMLPELVNGVKGAYKGYKQGGLIGAVQGAGKGLIAERDPDRISWGQQYMAKLQNLAGNENETTRRLAKGGTFSENGLRRVNSNAAGFGNAAGFYDPEYEKQMKAKMAAGSLQNNAEPNAELTDKKVTGEMTSAADMNKALVEGIKEGVKDAYLSPEVQEAQMNQAKETGKEIKTTLVG